ncbi:hypothetical protein F4813DRAFT_289416 [Daldinia decipiens]|uniref:uncharacterized protein n=1 Tax=Daldinia decipiens TaxID=326647 RepID=UPI0020C2B537|nr:uncharacterized protein F4813DRAFT_289416 [Daldinia decipiens]KAI1652852.1 hypothetical protein F4813DRAFT_289416 [Daldinia decipiens]
MSDQAEILPGRRNRQGSHEQLIQANPSMTPASNGRGQLTVDTSIQDTLERAITLDNTNHNSDEHKLPSEQMHEPDNHRALRDGDNERLTHYGHSYLACASFIQAFSVQQPANGSIETQGPTPTRTNLQQYLPQQLIVGNYALEFWKAETLYDGPLPVIPQLADPSYWLLQVETNNDHNNRESDLEAARNETRNGIYE